MRWAAFGIGSLILAGTFLVSARIAANDATARAAALLNAAVSVDARALSARFARFDALAASVGAGGLSTDRLMLTARLLRMQIAIPGTSAIFVVGKSGRVIAASAPLSVGAADVSQAGWFRAAIGLDNHALSLARINAAWLGLGQTLVLTRPVGDRDGTPIGVVGAVLGVQEAGTLLARGRLPPSSIVRLTASDGTRLAESMAAVAPEQAVGAQSVASRIMAQIAWLGVEPPDITASRTLSLIPARVSASMRSLAAWDAAWPDNGGAFAVIGAALGILWSILGFLMLRIEPRTDRAASAASDAARVAAETALAETEHRLAEMQRGLNETLQERDRALAAVSHDVRTPMNNILGICALLLDGDLEDEQRRWIERIASSCETLLAMLNGLLAIAGGDTGQAGLQTCDTDIAELVTEVSELLAPQANDKGLQLVTRLDDAVTGIWKVDPTRLRQVVFNLLANAVKYTTSGRVDVRAACVSKSDGATAIRITVADTGPGIAAEDRDRIFERFKRGRSDGEDPPEGVGLGLALCRDNAALMGGSLAVESTPGEGAEFSFEFPAERGRPAARLLPFTGRNALIVGLEETRREALRASLERFGFAVECAADGYVGLGMAERAVAARGVLDLVVVDLEMTGMAVEAFCLRLRSTGFGKEVALIGLAEDPNACSQVGMDAIAPRSSGAAAILAAVAELLGQQPALAALRPDALATGGGRVLIVEDNETNRSLWSVALARRGFTTFLARSGEEAVRLAERDNFDVILMDVQMPGMDGLEATRRIRALPGRAARVPIVAVTALGAAALQKSCAEAGVSAVIQKPVTIDRLIRELRQWIAAGPRDTGWDDASAEGGAEADPPHVEVSEAFLACMVDEVGLERTKACVREFLSNAVAKSVRLAELMPGWEAGAILRICTDLQDLAEIVGALSLSETIEELAAAVRDGDRDQAAALAERLEAMMPGLPSAMWACLRAIERRRNDDSRRAA